jgi:hypothetical protein
VSDYGLDDRGSIPDRGQGIFLLAPASRLALGPTQPPIQWVLGVLSPGVKRSRGVTLATHPHLVPRLSMSRSCTSSHPMCLHGMQRDSFTFFFYISSLPWFFAHTLLRVACLSSPFVKLSKESCCHAYHTAAVFVC